MDLSEYLLIERAVSDRLADLHASRESLPPKEADCSNATSTISAAAYPTNADDELGERLSEAA
jgi:hypothetical protein